MCDYDPDTQCAHCKDVLTRENKLYVVGAHVYVCSTPCYHLVVKKMRALFAERGKSIPETGERP